MVLGQGAILPQSSVYMAGFSDMGGCGTARGHGGSQWYAPIQTHRPPTRRAAPYSFGAWYAISSLVEKRSQPSTRPPLPTQVMHGQAQEHRLHLNKRTGPPLASFRW